MQQGLPEPGDVIGAKYVVERELGRGGMAAVFVVRHQLTGKRLALKCLLPRYIHDAEVITRFWREAQAAGRIQHRHVVDIYDVGREGELTYLIMELLDGKPLSELLTEGVLSIRRGLEIVLRAMSGVCAAHAKGVIHRDLKPDNIFVCRGPSGELDDPKVLDFGISKALDMQSVTQSGMSMGTPLYMSIEQLRGQRDVDARTDVYALGVILYQAISGRPPHYADSVPELMIKVLTQTPVHLDGVRSDLPLGLGTVVMKALRREREDRYESVGEMMLALEPFAPSTRSHSSAPVPPRPAVALDSTPRVQARAAAATEVPDPSTRTQVPTARLALPWWGLTGLGALALAGSTAWWLLAGQSMRSPDAPRELPTEELSQAAGPVTAPAITSPPEPSMPTSADAAAPRAEPLQEGPVQAIEDLPTTQHAGRHKHPRKAGNVLRARPAPTIAPAALPAEEPSSSPAPKDLPPERIVNKRAGQLGSSDF